MEIRKQGVTEKLIKSLKILHLNAQSINNKMLELEVLTSVENPNLLCISEHWLKYKDIEKVYYLQPYM